MFRLRTVIAALGVATATLAGERVVLFADEMELASKEFRAGNYKAACPRFAAIATRTQWWVAYYRAAQCHSVAGNWEEAGRLWTKAAEKCRDDRHRPTISLMQSIVGEMLVADKEKTEALHGLTVKNQEVEKAKDALEKAKALGTVQRDELDRLTDRVTEVTAERDRFKTRFETADANYRKTLRLLWDAQDENRKLKDRIEELERKLRELQDENRRLREQTKSSATS